ncbi:MAG: tetratricopeptide repeat protein [Bacteroidales bacterium]|nr:tetratricopeptide repeat protein [Bacteroidales bacterium]
MANTEKLGAKKSAQTEEQQQNFVSKSVEFYNKYQNVIYGVLIAIIVIVGGLIALNKFYIVPRNEKASAAIVKPIEMFAYGDSLALNAALEGTEEDDGFLTIISDYKMTRTANTAKYYAALCYLRQDNKEEALDYLLQFKKKEDVMWYAAQALIADLYDEQGEEETAIKYYKKAVKGEDPYFTPISLFKLGQMYERSENWGEALKCYQTIENDFYEQYAAMGVDRYLERATLKSAK